MRRIGIRVFSEILENINKPLFSVVIVGAVMVDVTNWAFSRISLFIVVVAAAVMETAVVVMEITGLEVTLAVKSTS